MATLIEYISAQRYVRTDVPGFVLFFDYYSNDLVSPVVI